MTELQLRKRVKAVVGREQHQQWMACKTRVDYLNVYLAHDPITRGHVKDIAKYREQLKVLKRRWVMAEL